MSKQQRKSNPYTPLDRSIGIQKVETSKISRQSAHKVGKIVSHKYRLSPPPPPPFPEIPLVLISVSLSQPQGHSAVGRIKSMKNPSDLIGN
jgi:hypothetical protein